MLELSFYAFLSQSEFWLLQNTCVNKTKPQQKKKPFLLFVTGAFIYNDVWLKISRRQVKYKYKTLPKL